MASAEFKKKIETRATFCFLFFAGTQAQAQAILLLISIVKCRGNGEEANNMHSSKCERVFERLTSGKQTHKHKDCLQFHSDANRPGRRV